MFFFVDVMSRNDPLDSTSVEFPPSHYDGHVSDPSKERPLQGLKFGVPKEYFISGLSDAMLKAWNTGIEELERLGASAVSVSLPNTQHALQSYYVIAPAEASSNLSKFDGVRFGK